MNYFLNEKQYRTFIASVYQKLAYDEYDKYKICNIYFDTIDYNSNRTHVKNALKGKENDNMFLEINRKVNGVIYKSRIILSYRFISEDCFQDRKAGFKNLMPEDISSIIRSRQLCPRLYFSYDRVVMKGMYDNALSITFDTNICWRFGQKNVTEDSMDAHKISTGNYIMKIKNADSMPLWLDAAINNVLTIK